MKTTPALLILFGLICCPAVRADAPPDFAAMDRDTLVMLCERQYLEIQRLRAELAQTGPDSPAAVGDGSWVVTITSVNVPDPAPHKARIDALRERIDGTPNPATGQRSGGITERIRDAEAVLAEVTKRGKWRSTSNPDGYTRRELNNATAPVRAAQNEKRAAEYDIRGLEQAIQREAGTVTAHGTTPGGEPVLVIAKGIYVTVGRSLVVGQTYTVTGRDRGGELSIKTAVPLN